MKKLTQEIFIQRSLEKHCHKYHYLYTNFVKCATKVVITCPLHGNFLQSPSHHLRGRGCTKCWADKVSFIKGSDSSEFINKAKKVHTKYDYSKVLYLDSRTKVDIVCHVHGVFRQTPNGHLRGNGCPGCKKVNLTLTRSHTTEKFIEEAVKVHGDSINYDEVRYVNSLTKVKLICVKHGAFYQLPVVHTRGFGCTECTNDRLRNLYSFSLEEFVGLAVARHGHKYSYLKSEYYNSVSEITVTCPIHGDFTVCAGQHLAGSGCRKCRGSKGERAITRILKENNISFKREYRLPEYNFRYRYDFYLPDYKLLIEFHGGQHYFPVDFFGGTDGFKKIKHSDTIKRMLAKDTGRNIIYFNYKHLRLPSNFFYKKVLSSIKRFSDAKNAPLVLTSLRTAPYGQQHPLLHSAIVSQVQQRKVGVQTQKHQNVC